MINNQSEEIRYSERSVLYSLVPIKKGTPFVESISSYICRLAFEHNVDVTTLLFQIIVPSIQGESGLKSTHSFGKTHTILGVGQTALKIVEALEILTARKDLNELTLLNWKPIMRVALISKKKKWCSSCLREMQQRDEIYEPLIWQLREASRCLKHLEPLCNSCWNCNREIPYIRTGMVVGYCPFCNSFLGKEVVRSYRELRIMSLREERVFKVYSDLLAYNRPLKVPSYTYVQNLISEIRSINPNIAAKHFSSVLSIGEKRLVSILNGIDKPDIIFWSEMCEYLDISIHELLGGKLQDENLKKKIRKINNRDNRKTLDEDTLAKMHDMLIDYTEEVTIMTLSAYAKQNKIDQRRLKTHFPDLYKSAIAKSGRIQVEEKKNYYKNIEKEIRKYISLNQKPLSLRNTASKFGITEPTLLRRLPELYQDIKENYANYTLEKYARNYENHLFELRGIIIKLHNEGTYPSLMRIGDEHSYKILFRYKKYRNERKKILKELGYDVE